MARKKKAPPGHERHHRHCRSRKASFSGDINHERNISIVKVGDHRAYHQIFGNMTPPEMAEMLNEVWISPDFYLVAIPRAKAQGKRRRRYWCTTCDAEVLKHLPTTKGEDND